MPPNKPFTKTSPIHQTPAQAELMLEPGEAVLTVVHRSIIALLGIYLEVAAGVAAVVALVVILSPDTVHKHSSATLLLIAILFATLIIFILVLVTYIYLQNKLVITDRGVIQITQRGPFAHKAARLSIASVEDVSSDQKGFLATAFNYGTLLIQTAGTLDNFEFSYCPDPTRYAHQILEAREAYAEALRESNETP